MLRRYLLIAVGCLIAVPNIAMASLGIGVKGGDPTCGDGQTFDIDLTGASESVQSQDVQPDGFSGTTCFIVTNNTSGIVNSLDFDMTINAGLVTPDDLNVVGPGGIFSISQIGGAGYFLHESLTYNNGSGNLNFDFFGVKPPDGDESCGFSYSPKNCEINEQEGIPPGGIFTIELTGWVSNYSVSDPIQVYGNLPNYSTSFTETPEPSTFFALAVGFLVIAAVVESRRRRSLRSSHF